MNTQIEIINADDPERIKNAISVFLENLADPNFGRLIKEPTKDVLKKRFIKLDQETATAQDILDAAYPYQIMSLIVPECDCCGIQLNKVAKIPLTYVDDHVYFCKGCLETALELFSKEKN